MLLAINQLTPADSARLVLDTLHSYWPGCHFTTSFSDDALILRWMDGPIVSDVMAVADRFTPDPAASDWENSVIIAHPDGNLEAVLPTFPHLDFQRDFSAKTVLHIANDLRMRGIMPDVGGNGVRLILQAQATHHPAALAIHTQLAELSEPLPADNWQREADIYEPMLEDLAVTKLCAALREWDTNPEGFAEWDTVYDAFSDAELQAVLVSALADNKPSPGSVEALLDAVISDCLENGDVETVAGADFVRDLMVLDSDPEQEELFARPESAEASVLITMGRFLREVTGADL